MYFLYKMRLLKFVKRLVSLLCIYFVYYKTAKQI